MSELNEEVREMMYQELQAEIERKEIYGDKGTGYLRAMWLVAHGPTQTPQINDEEHAVIHCLRKGSMSYRDIGFILDRPKSTVFEASKRPIKPNDGQPPYTII